MVNFMGVALNLIGKEELLEAIDKAIPDHSIQIATVNPEFMVEAGHSATFKQALGAMTYCTVDGSGLFLILKLWQRLIPNNQKIPERYPGATLVKDMFSTYSNGQKKFFLVGGKPGLVQKAATTIQGLYPNIAIVGCEDGGIIDAQKIEIDQNLIERIQKAKPDILLVGFGAPKQELWIQAAKKAVSIPVMIGIGGTLGFYTDKKRAPEWMQNNHLEWAFRLMHEPNHLKRVWRAVVVFSLQALGWIGWRYIKPLQEEPQP